MTISRRIRQTRGYSANGRWSVLIDIGIEGVQNIRGIMQLFFQSRPETGQTEVANVCE